MSETAFFARLEAQDGPAGKPPTIDIPRRGKRAQNTRQARPVARKTVLPEAVLARLVARALRAGARELESLFPSSRQPGIRGKGAK